MAQGKYNNGNKSRSNGNSQNRNQSNNSQKGGNEPYVKRTGCDMVDTYTHKAGPNKGKDSGTPCIWGWRVVQGGIQKFVAAMNHEPATKKERWLKMVVTVTPPNGTAPKFLTTGFWDVNKQRLHMPDLDLIANPAKNYWGRNYTPSK